MLTCVEQGDMRESVNSLINRILKWDLPLEPCSQKLEMTQTQLFLLFLKILVVGIVVEKIFSFVVFNGPYHLHVFEFPQEVIS